MRPVFVGRDQVEQDTLTYKNTEKIRRELELLTQEFEARGGEIQQIGNTLVKYVQPEYGQPDIVKKARMRGASKTNSGRRTWKGKK